MGKLLSLFIMVSFLLSAGTVWSQTGKKISQMPPGGNYVSPGDILPALRGTTSSGFVNYQMVMPLGSTTTPGLLQCGSGLSCSAGIISGASFPSLTSNGYKYLMANPDGTTVSWTPPASLIDPRTYAGSVICPGPGYSGGLSSSNQGILIANGGASYTNGTYTSVSLTGGSGSGGVATIVVSGNKISAVTITTAGSGYKLRDQLSAAAANIGGTGTGFVAQVAHFSANQLPIYDGVNDMTAAFQAAFAVAQNTGQGVLVPNGCWVTTLNIPQGVSMVGSGYSPTYGFDSEGGTASNMPVLYEEANVSFVIHMGASPNNGFAGFEINDSANGAFETANCIGSDVSGGGGSTHFWVRSMSMVNCLAGIGSTSNAALFPISIGNNYGANVYGMTGHLDDLQSVGDTFNSNSGAGMLINGGLQNIVGDRFEFNGEGIDCNCSGINITSDQFDSNTNAGIRFINGSGNININNSTFIGNGFAATTGNDAAIIDGRNTSDLTTFPPYMNISDSTFYKTGNGGLQPYALDVTTTGADNDYISVSGGNALTASTSGFAIYRNGQPPHMKFNNVTGVANYDSMTPPLTVSGCSNSNVTAGETTGAFTSGVTGNCAVTVVPSGTLSTAQPNGWSCGSFLDKTTTTNTASWQQLGYTTTSAALSGTTSTGDVVSFSCNRF